MTIIDYALVGSNPLVRTAMLLDTLFREAVRIKAIQRYSAHVYEFSDQEKQSLKESVEIYTRLRNEAPFRAWAAFGLYGGSRIDKLQNYLAYTTDSRPECWLGAADHDGILPTISDYIAQQQPLSAASFELLQSQGGFCFSWHPKMLYSLLKNHVTFANDFSWLGAPFRASFWTDKSCPIFAGGLTGEQWKEIFEIAFLRKYASFFRAIISFAVKCGTRVDPYRVNTEATFHFPVSYWQEKIHSLPSAPYSWDTTTTDFVAATVRADTDARDLPLLDDDKHSYDSDNFIYRRLPDLVPLPNATISKPEEFKLPESEPYKQRPENWLLEKLNLPVNDNTLSGVDDDQQVLQKQADVERWIGAGNCSFSVTGDNGAPHYFFVCDTCVSDADAAAGIGFCGGCARHCHKGHKVRLVGFSTGFYCDCGAGGRVGKYKCQIVDLDRKRNYQDRPSNLPPIEWRNDYRLVPLNSAGIARYYGYTLEPSVWPRLVRACVDNDLPKFKEALNEHYEESYSTGDKEPWRIFSYLDTLKVDLLLYAFVHVKEGLVIPREILKWMFRAFKAAEARVAATKDGDKAEHEKATKQLVETRCIFVFLNARFKEYVGDKMQRFWSLPKYTEIDAYHTEVKTDLWGFVQEFQNYLVDGGFDASFSNSEGWRCWIVIPDVLREIVRRKCKRGIFGALLPLILRDADMRKAIDWTEAFNLYFDYHNGSDLFCRTSLILRQMGIDGEAIYSKVDKERLRKFLLECPYVKDVDSTRRTALAREVFTEGELKEIADQRASSGLKTVDEWANIESKVSPTETVLGNRTFDHWVAYAETNPSADMAAFVALCSIEASNKEFEESIKPAVVRHFEAYGLKPQLVDSCLSASRSVGEVSPLNKDITGIDDVTFDKIKWSAEWWYPKFVWPNFELPAYKPAQAPVLEPSPMPEKLNLKELISMLDKVPMRKSSHTWEFDWRQATAYQSVLMEEYKAQKAEEKRKSEEAAAKKAAEAAEAAKKAAAAPPAQPKATAAAHTPVPVPAIAPAATIQGVKMILKEAVLLTPADSNGLADPYVKLKQKGEKLFKSKVIKKTLKPVWNEKFSVNLRSEGGKIKVIVEVWDQDAFTSEIMCSGEIVVDVHPDGKILFPSELKVQLKNKAGKDDGTVTFNFV